MRKLVKNKFGFTLVEIILVVAIIVILAGALFISADRFLGKADDTSGRVSASQVSVSNQNAEMEGKLAGYGF